MTSSPILRSAALQKSLALKPSGPGYSNLGTILYFLGRYDEAVQGAGRFGGDR